MSEPKYIGKVNPQAKTAGSISPDAVVQLIKWYLGNNNIGGGAGVTDHGALSGLADDDHPQYHNNTRGDARYYTQTLADSTFEPALGNPATTGYVLESTTAGVRSWSVKGATTMTELNNYTETSAAVDDFIVYNGAGEYVNKSAATIGISEVGHDHSGLYYTASDTPTITGVWTFSGQTAFTHESGSNPPFTVPASGYEVPNLNVNKLQGKTLSDLNSDYEADLGLPATTGYVLESTTTGVRSWSAKGATTMTELTDYIETSVADKEIISYESSSGNYINRTASELGLSLDTHLHPGVYEPADATILKDADIGVTVQAYSANNAFLANITYEQLNTNGDVGTGAGQLAIGNHTHSNYITSNAADTASAETTWSAGGVQLNNNVYLQLGTGTEEGRLYSDGSHTILDMINGDFKIADSGTVDFMFKGDGNAVFHADGNIIGRSDSLTSDKRKKKGVETIDPSYALDVINKSRAVTFNWKDENYKGLQSGFIAQEIEETLPHLIKEVDELKSDGTYKTMSYTQMIPYNTASIQALSQKIDKIMNHLNLQ